MNLETQEPLINLIIQSVFVWKEAFFAITSENQHHKSHFIEKNICPLEVALSFNFLVCPLRGFLRKMDLRGGNIKILIFANVSN
jgi:hypothetical protein